MKNNLAIVIPAYKCTYLDEVLRSISEQTNKDFTVYIGDDNSSCDIYSIVQKYEKSYDLEYKKFPHNIGENDLVAQWQRCIDMSCEEEWIWLFSDDDIMGSDCVEKFYDSVNKKPNTSVFRFDLNIIDENSNLIEVCSSLPDTITPYEFVIKRFSGSVSSFVVEYIFRRSAYKGVGGFPKFDLAWNSDDAMWISLSTNSQIVRINGSSIKWRASNENITRDKKNALVIKRKLDADIAYLLWIKKHFNKTSFGSKQILFQRMTLWFIVRLYGCKDVISAKELECYKKRYFEEVLSRLLAAPALIYYHYLRG